MKLLTKEIQDKIPPLYAQDELGDDAIVHVKFFSIVSDWQWYATEFDPQERVFFGFVHGFEDELGYFSLDELESLGIRIERDKYFTPIKLGRVREIYRRQAMPDVMMKPRG